jgi:hypothetical protein
MYLLLFLSVATKKPLRENKLPDGLTENASLISGGQPIIQ